MLKEALKIVEGKELDSLKKKLSGVHLTIKDGKTTGEKLKKAKAEAETLKAKIAKLSNMKESEEDPAPHEYNEGPNRSNNPSLQVLHVIEGMESMLQEMRHHLKWERKEETKMMKKGSGSREHEKELLYYEQQIDLMEGMIKQLKAAVPGIQQMERDGGMVNESIKLVHTEKNDAKKSVAKVYHMTGADDQGDPFMVKLFVDGKHKEFADYFTDDKADAVGTAKHMVKEGAESQKDFEARQKRIASHQETPERMARLMKIPGFAAAHGLAQKTAGKKKVVK